MTTTSTTKTTNTEVQQKHKLDEGYGWVIVAALFVIYFNSIGLTLTLGMYVDKIVMVTYMRTQSYCNSIENLPLTALQ